MVKSLVRSPRNSPTPSSPNGNKDKLSRRNKRTCSECSVRRATLRTLMVIVAFGSVCQLCYHVQIMMRANNNNISNPHLQEMQNLGLVTNGHLVKNNNQSEKAVNINNAEENTKTEKKPSRFAIAFLLGGIHEDFLAYKGFLFNILVATQILRKAGSQSDVWVLAQFAPNSTLTNSLPDEDVRLLEQLDIHIRMLDKPKSASFLFAMYEKFHILEMTQYERVLYLDGDIIPVSNLDYLLDMTTTGVLRPNLVVATRAEPSNGGFFILQPQPQSYEELRQIIVNQHIKAKDLPYPRFDFVNGWGHNFQKHKDQWDGVYKSSNRWKFWGSHVDQGLLYYWVKYHQKNVSIVIGDRIEHWAAPDGGSGDSSSSLLPVKVGVMHQNETKKYATDLPVTRMGHCIHPNPRGRLNFLCLIPYRDYIHFSGKTKPWQLPKHRLKFQWSSSVQKGGSVSVDPTMRWFQELQELNQKLDMKIDGKFWEVTDFTSPLGYKPTYGDHNQLVEEFHAAREEMEKN